MPKQKLTTHVLLTVFHDQPIKDLTDIVACRIYCVDGVTNTDAALLPQQAAIALGAPGTEQAVDQRLQTQSA